jgi:hypothetical protein
MDITEVHSTVIRPYIEEKRVIDVDVYLEYYSGIGFHINYFCLHILRKTHKLVQCGISKNQNFGYKVYYNMEINNGYNG